MIATLTYAGPKAVVRFDQAVTDQAVPDQAVTDQAVTDQAVTDQAVTDQASYGPGRPAPDARHGNRPDLARGEGLRQGVGDAVARCA